MQSPKMEGLDKREAALSDSESPIKHDDSLTANHGHNGSRLPTNVPVADHAVFISNNANNHYYTDDPLSDDDALSDVKVFPGSFSTAEIKGLPGSFSTIAVADAFAQRMTGNGSGSYAFKFRNQDEFFQAFPPGYRFKPSDEDLVVHYLHKKISNQRLPPNRIKDVELYKHNPDALAALHQSCEEKEWYFLTPRDRKYRNGVRPNRKAGDGYWKATGADKVVNYKGNKVGFRKALVFYTGKPPKGTKTDWIMHEFRVDNPPKRPKTANNDMRLDDWVLCRIYKKVDKSSKPPNRQRDNAVPEQPSGQQVSELNYVDNPLVAMPEINGIYSDLGFLGTYDNFIYPDYETGLLGDPRNEPFRLPECFPLDQATPYVGKLVFDHSSAVMANSPLSKLPPQTTLQSRQLNEFNEDEVLSDQRQENLDFLSSDSDVHLEQ